jgi:hypothetical protein
MSAPLSVPVLVSISRFFVRVYRNVTRFSPVNRDLPKPMYNLGFKKYGFSDIGLSLGFIRKYLLMSLTSTFLAVID